MNVNQAVKVLLLVTVLTAESRTCTATVYFENTGNLTGWSTLWQERGSLAEVNIPTYKGATAVRARTVFDPNYRGRYHTELRKGGMCTLGMDRFYSFTFYLPSDWQFVDQSFNIQQFIANVNGCSGGQPATMTHLQNHALITRITTGPDGCTRSHQPLTVTSNVTSGTWHRIVFHGKWAADNTGIFQYWYDGTQVINKQNLPTIPNDDTVFNYAVGNYSNGWHDDGMMVGAQGTRDVFVDHIRVTSSYAEADPESWSGENAPPSISAINDQFVTMNGTTGAISFVIADPDTPLTSLALSATTSNPALVPAPNLVFSGTDSHRSLIIAPATNLTGTSIVTVTVNDGKLKASTSFSLSVIPSAIQSWRQQYFGTPNGTGDAADFADPDKDGVVNIAEFLLNSDPVRPVVPIFSVAIEEPYFVLAYTRRKSALAEVNLVYESAESPTGPWNTATMAEEIISQNDTLQVLKAKLPINGTTQQYLRLNITKRP